MDYNEDYDYVFRDLQELKIVGDIIEGKIILTKENIADYAASSKVVNAIYTDGGLNVAYMDPAEMLKDWKGCKDLIDSLGESVKAKSETFCH
jgi:hypothetical protein